MIRPLLLPHLAGIPAFPTLHLGIYDATLEELGDGHWRVTFEPKTVRPAGSTLLDELYLVTAGTAPLRVKWEATATNAAGRRTGEFEMPASDQAITLDEVLAPLKTS